MLLLLGGPFRSQKSRGILMRSWEIRKKEGENLQKILLESIAEKTKRLNMAQYVQCMHSAFQKSRGGGGGGGEGGGGDPPHPHLMLIIRIIKINHPKNHSIQCQNCYHFC